MTVLLVKMSFKSPLHCGAGGWGMEEVDPLIRSDTLWSALACCSVELGGPAEVNARVSSAYPFAGSTLYFPKPMLRLTGAVQGEEYLRENAKAVKSLQYVDEASFRAWVSGTPVDLDMMIDLEKSLLDRVCVRVRPRVGLDRAASISHLYFVGDVVFAGDVGLYCLVECDDSDRDYVQELFRHLGETGIGGERTSGYGRFVPTFGEWEPPAPAARTYVSLSLVNPHPSELASVVAYGLCERGGWVYSKTVPDTALKPMVCMLREGSVFSSRVEGRMVDVTPRGWSGHRVWRNGRAVLVGAGVDV